MTERSRRITRRALIENAAGAVAAATLGGCAAEPATTPQRASRVVLVRRREVLDDRGSVRPEVLHRMLDEAVTALLDAPDSSTAWRRLVSADDVVGVKSNVWSHLPTPPALERAIRAGLEAAGVAPDSIAVDDRGVRTHPIFTRATALVNVRPLRTHYWSGLGTCIKNLIPFVPRPSAYHGDACASLGALWHLPETEGKVRLNVLVMLTPQFHSIGPHSFSSHFVWPYCGLLVGLEPAPVDATGARVIAEQRRRYFGEERPIAPPPHHIEIGGERYGLGPTARDAIELVRLGEGEGALV